MSREHAVARAREVVDSGELFNRLKGWVAFETESQNPDRGPELRAYFLEGMTPYLESLGFKCRLLDNPDQPRLPFLFGQRQEGEDLLTLLTYGHGDTVRSMEGRWREGLHPWELIAEGERWYGRGAADNKGQHAINLAALAAVLEERGRLGFNVKILLESGEEMGSPGLHRVCEIHRDLLKADLLIASDGPRLTPERPTIFGGSRGVANFDLKLRLREGGHHSGNWGGLLANPGTILANAIACLVDGRGRVQVPELKPKEIPGSVRRALAELDLSRMAGPEMDPDWGEPGLTPAEKLFGWSTLDVLAMKTGDPDQPTHAIPPQAFARLHTRFVADQDPESFIPGIRRRLDHCGFQEVKVVPVRGGYTRATRLLPDDRWAVMAMDSLERTSGVKPAFLPNTGGTLPNDAFSHILGLPTVWVPHSYSGCSQHAPDEHLLASLAREGVGLMAGLFWDLSRVSPQE